MAVNDARGSTGESPQPGGRARRVADAAGPAAAWGLAFLILRIFAVSGYDWDTSFEVSTTLSVNEGLSLVFGSLMAGPLLVAVLLVGVLPLLMATCLWSPRGRRAVVVVPTAIAAVALVALTATYHGWWLPVAATAVFATFAVVHRTPERGEPRRALAVAMKHVGRVAGIAVLLLAAFVQTPWVPQERIETTHGPIAGYVLSVDPGYLNVLTDGRKFVILNRNDVRSRHRAARSGW